MRDSRTAKVEASKRLLTLDGHKWFCSAPMSDAFLVLAYTDRGLSCFLLPRWLPDGTKNRFHIQRLKDKLGNRSNASSEVKFDAAWARMVGDASRLARDAGLAFGTLPRGVDFRHIIERARPRVQT